MSDNNVIQLNDHKLWCEHCGEHVSQADVVGDNFHTACRYRLYARKPENSNWRDTPYLERI